jgi:hypothetical protein
MRMLPLDAKTIYVILYPSIYLCSLVVYGEIYFCYYTCNLVIYAHSCQVLNIKSTDFVLKFQKFTKKKSKKRKTSST